jgi:hypothetical protein
MRSIISIYVSMDTPIQPSFIPKKPVVGQTPRSHTGGGLFYYIGSTIFTVAVVACVVLFAYQYYLNGQIAKMNLELTQAREALQPELIKALSRSSKRFASAEEILKQHVTVSAFFNVLQKLTLQTVRFSSFAYDMKPEGIVVTMKGEAKSYATVAQQAKIISEDPAFKSAQFSDLDLNTKGNVIFAMKAVINPATVSYAAGINSLLAPQNSQIPAQIEETAPTATSSTAVSNQSTSTTTPKQP